MPLRGGCFANARLYGVDTIPASYCRPGRTPWRPSWLIVHILPPGVSCSRIVSAFQRGRRSYAPAAALRLPKAVRNLPVAPPPRQPTCHGPLRDTITALAAMAFPPSSPNARPCAFDAASLRALRHACEALLESPKAPATELQKRRLQALSDHARLGLRQVQVAMREQQLRERARGIDRPGARSGTAMAFSLGMEAGLPGAVALGTTLSVGTGGLRSCFETLEYAEGSEHRAAVSAHIGAGVPAIGLGLSARAAFGASRTHYDGAVTADEFAQVRARERVAAPLRARLLQRLRGVFNPQRREPVDRIAKAARAVVRWEALMPALLGNDALHAGATRNLPNQALLPAPTPMLDVWIDGTTRQFSAGARFAGFDAGVQYARTRQAVGLEVPCWLPSTPLDEEQRVALERSLHEKLQAELLGKRSLSEVLSLPPSTTATPREMLQQVRHQFDHLQQLRITAELGPGQARAQAKKICQAMCAQWNARDLQATLARMLELVHWIALGTETADPAQCPVRKQAAALADDIRSSPAMRQDAQALRRTHACIHMYQHFDTRLVQVDLGAALPGIMPGASLQVAHTRQHNYNPLRTGHYIEASLSLSAPVEASALWQTLQQRIPPLAGSHMPGDFGVLLHEAIADEFSAGATATLTLRFFKPAFQDESGFDAAAAGMHLQQVTCRSTASLGLSATLPLRGTGLAGATAGASIVHERARPLREDVFCSGTLTALLLRYQSLLGQGLAPAAAWRVMLDNHAGSLRRLAEALAAPRGTARAEAEYWLDKTGRDPADVDWTSLGYTPVDRTPPERWRARRSSAESLPAEPAASEPAPPPLQVLLDSVLLGVNAAQKRSSMRSPLQLHGARMKMPRF